MEKKERTEDCDNLNASTTHVRDSGSEKIIASDIEPALEGVIEEDCGLDLNAPTADSDGAGGTKRIHLVATSDGLFDFHTNLAVHSNQTLGNTMNVESECTSELLDSNL